MEEEKAEGKKLNNNAHIKLLQGLLLIALIAVTIFEIFYEDEYKTKLRDRILAAQELEDELQIQVDAYENELKNSTINYAKDISAKSCIILCFDQFGKSAYRDIIDEMDKYGFTGVMIFRDGKVPGSKGSISVELYQELLDKGWESAIGNSSEIIVYDNFPSEMKKKWLEYIEKMKVGFQGQGLDAPEIYIPHKKEAIEEVTDLMIQTGMSSLAVDYGETQEAATDMNTDSMLSMGMIVGKYSYNTLSTDIKTLLPEAKSMAIWFKKVENGAPENKQYTSIYMVKRHLERLSILGDYIKVTTFSGYKEYQKNLIEKNQVRYREYLVQQNNLLNQIIALKTKISENYERALKQKDLEELKNEE